MYLNEDPFLPERLRPGLIETRNTGGAQTVSPFSCRSAYAPASLKLLLPRVDNDREAGLPERLRPGLIETCGRKPQHRSGDGLPERLRPGLIET